MVSLRTEIACMLALSLVASGAPQAAQKPCDIYAAGGTSCVAAHSTTRALYGSYTGPLYQVQRASDKATKDISTVNGIADAASQDSFCAGTNCTIPIIYDQSPNKNHLTVAPPGSAGSGPGPNGFDLPAGATNAPIKLGGKKVYGVFVSPGVGYRNNKAKGTATGDNPQGIYAVLDGTHRNNKCCFDYGNAETNSRDNGNGHMETIYFGESSTGGAWIGADLENGLFSGPNRGPDGKTNIDHRFITAVVKGKQNQWAIRGGNAASGSLSNFFSGPRPTGGYNPMQKEGAIILGIGGDNSHGGQGTFYEGIMTSTYPSDATENAVQSNIVAAGYST